MTYNKSLVLRFEQIWLLVLTLSTLALEYTPSVI